jgi:enoyl-CoA hydratase
LCKPLEALAVRRFGLIELFDQQINGQFQRAIDKLVAKIAQKSPLGLAAMKQLVGDALEQPLAIALRSEQKALEAHLHSYDVREGLSAFREKRAPHFEGR